MLRAKERFARYLQRRYGDRSTPKHYLSDLQMFVQLVGAKAPQSVTAGDIDQFVDQQISKGLQPATINRCLAALHTFFEFLASDEPDEAWPNPVNWRRHPVKQGQTLPRDASETEVARLFAVIDDPRDRAMFGLMVGTGLRVGGVADLLCANLEAPSGSDQSARLRVRGKGRKERLVWVTPRWYSAIQTWLTQRPAAETDHLFLNQHSRPLSVSGIQHRFNQYCQQAGVHLTCHQLRHTFARRLADEQMPTESIAQLLGHTQLETTKRYTAGANPDLREAFLQTMAAIEETPALAPQADLALLRPQSRPERADPQALERVIGRLADMPGWLQPLLAAYLRQRWRNWPAHTAAQNARVLSSKLKSAWNWLLTHRQLSGLAALRRTDLEAWLEARAKAGISPGSRTVDLSALLSCLVFAQEQELPVSVNLLRVAAPTRPAPLPRYLTPEAYQRLVETVCEKTAGDTPRAILYCFRTSRPRLFTHIVTPSSRPGYRV